MFIGFIIIIVGIFLDQLTKYIATITLVAGAENVIIPKLLSFNLLYNDGASFGMLQGNQLFFAIVTVAALIIFGYLFLDSNFKNKKVYSISVALFIAGSLGNAIDRIFVPQGVIDMIHIPIIPIFATFNFADAYMNIAIVLFIIDLLFLESRRTNANKDL